MLKRKTIHFFFSNMYFLVYPISQPEPEEVLSPKNRIQLQTTEFLGTMVFCLYFIDKMKYYQFFQINNL